MSKIIVDPIKCLGCGMCERLYPEVFKLEKEVSNVIEGAQISKEGAKDAISSCPGQAISLEPDK